MYNNRKRIIFFVKHDGFWYVGVLFGSRDDNVGVATAVGDITDAGGTTSRFCIFHGVVCARKLFVVANGLFGVDDTVWLPSDAA